MVCDDKTDQSTRVTDISNDPDTSFLNDIFRWKEQPVHKMSSVARFTNDLKLSLIIGSMREINLKRRMGEASDDVNRGGNKVWYRRSSDSRIMCALNTCEIGTPVCMSWMAPGGNRMGNHRPFKQALRIQQIGGKHDMMVATGSCHFSNHGEEKQADQVNEHFGRYTFANVPFPLCLRQTMKSA